MRMDSDFKEAQSDHAALLESIERQKQKHRELFLANLVPRFHAMAD